MDNLSHTLAGLVAGETVSEKARAQPTKRLLFLVASALANNFPDLDLIYSDIAPPPLGYLLHHRGHTHTLGGAVAQLLLIFGILWLVPSFRRELKDKSTLKVTGLLIALGLCLHFFMDSWNSYGIHPFWPFSSRWFYGDVAFILEPLLWTCLAVPLFFTLKSRVARVILALPTFGIPVAALFLGLLKWHSAALIAVLAVFLLGLCLKFETTLARLRIGSRAAVTVLATLFVGAQVVRARLETSFVPESPDHRLIDVITSTLPASPLCWNTIRVERNDATGMYRVEAKPVFLLPGVNATDECAKELLLFRVAEVPLAELRDAARRDCFVDAWLDFARAPVLEGGKAFDMRFAATTRENFTHLGDAGRPRACPPFLARWDKPRQDLLD